MSSDASSSQPPVVQNDIAKNLSSREDSSSSPIKKSQNKEGEICDDWEQLDQNVIEKKIFLLNLKLVKLTKFLIKILAN